MGFPRDRLLGDAALVDDDRAIGLGLTGDARADAETEVVRGGGDCSKLSETRGGADTVKISGVTWLLGAFGTSINLGGGGEVAAAAAAADVLAVPPFLCPVRVEDRDTGDPFSITL
jgi:hypothetical protein